MLEAEAEASVEAARSAAATSVSEAKMGNEVKTSGYILSEICPEILTSLNGGVVEFFDTS